MALKELNETQVREIRRLLKVRKRNRKEFRRYLSWRWTKLDDSWRYPKGRDNKVRLQYKGYPPKVKVGYRAPKLVRYLHPSGRREVLVRRVEDLFIIDPATEAARIASSVGQRKRLQIIQFAKNFGIHILNPRKPPEMRLETPPQPLEEKLEKLVEEIEAEERPKTESERKTTSESGGS
ncbi:MAG: 50S ribosomal protein L32e [Crenarchaeota archaeon]|nr:50S ribosomal protein L32e [Thermoproteota archaeon]MCR8453573.1 50S ribosomal protein L32e [Thermoproteota archaeon]MCR8454784.1 50S ribosomal protein L32e [Thermoproteota archaeon]MCR8462676.1 50S ribosomal protein L32e [Thermoproteota archaeon]MCR8470295.1 50S ribosomal protein L32e [Thermoproteota archaeon]